MSGMSTSQPVTGSSNNDNHRAVLITGDTGFILSYLARKLIREGKDKLILFDLYPNPKSVEDISGHIGACDIAADRSPAGLVLRGGRQPGVDKSSGLDLSMAYHCYMSAALLLGQRDSIS
jgi:hypothetical protein